MPEAVPFRQKAFYTGAQGSTAHDAAVVEEAPGRIVFRTTAPLPAFAGLTVAAGWQKGVLAPPRGPGLIERAFAFIHDAIVASWIFQHLPQVMAGLGLPLVLAYYAYAWFRIGGAPRRGTVIPLFTPPEGMSAAATRYVRRMEFDGKTFTAALLQLAVNGHLKLVESKKTITIEQQAGGKPVGDAEATAEMRLFHTEPKVPLTRSSALELMSAMNGLKSVFKKHYDNVAFSSNTAWAVYGLLASFAVMAAVVAANWTQDGDLFSSTLFALLLPVPAMMLGLVLLSGALRSQGMDTVRGLIFGLMFAGGGGYFGLWILFAYRQDWLEVLPTAMAFALAPVAAFAFPLFRMPTAAGRKLIDAIEGFRMYLGVAEEDRLQAFYPPKKTPELFERYLPYAVALDVENAWAKRFEGVLENAETSDRERLVHRRRHQAAPSGRAHRVRQQEPVRADRLGGDAAWNQRLELRLQPRLRAPRAAAAAARPAAAAVAAAARAGDGARKLRPAGRTRGNRTRKPQAREPFPRRTAKPRSRSRPP